MKREVTEIINQFEQGSISDAEAIAKLQAITGKKVDLLSLREYWAAVSKEDLVDDLCAEPIVHFERITDEEAIALVSEFLQTQSSGRRNSIETALSRRYGKTYGTLHDLVFQEDMTDPAQILEKLKVDTRIYL